MACQACQPSRARCAALRYAPFVLGEPSRARYQPAIFKPPSRRRKGFPESEQHYARDFIDVALAPWLARDEVQRAESANACKLLLSNFAGQHCFAHLNDQIQEDIQDDLAPERDNRSE